MSTTHLTSLRTDDVSSRRLFPFQNGSLSSKIAALSTLVISLQAAVDDLESYQLPPLEAEFDFYEEVRRFEISLIRRALKATRGSQIRAAQLLKINPTTLNTKIKHYRICVHER